MENIRYGRPDATDEEIVEAAKRAEIYDDIMAMPHGFDTYVGERGTMLSGGQKQRVSIARIFLKNPPILILDEATSALDSVTEVKIQHAFDELARGRTASRPSARRTASSSSRMAASPSRAATRRCSRKTASMRPSGARRMGKHDGQTAAFGSRRAQWR